ncbi:MAG: hypothetical protein SGARI_003503 [Bacillariaceae sp.]
MGGILAWVEGVAFLEGFLYVTSNLLQMATPMTEFNPTNAVGVIIDVYASIIALLSFGIILNVVNLFQIPLAINSFIEKRISTHRILVPFVALAFVIPFCISLLAVAFGCILAGFEGWAVEDGILYVFSNILGLATSLTTVSPETIAGGIFDVILSSMALGGVAVFVDYVTVLNPARYIRKRTKEFLAQRGASQLKSTHPLDYGGRTTTTVVQACQCNGEANENSSTLDATLPETTCCNGISCEKLVVQDDVESGRCSVVEDTPRDTSAEPEAAPEPSRSLQLAADDSVV